jgi:preprotein translocase subunit SecD
MRRITSLLILLATPAIAAERNFMIDSEIFAEAEIIDARAQPELDGTSSIRITFNETAAKRIATVTLRLVGKPAHVALNSEAVADPIIREPISDGVLQLSGPWSLESATLLAKKISGKDPLPDSLEE